MNTESAYQGAVNLASFKTIDTGLLAARTLSLWCTSNFDAHIRLSDEPFIEDRGYLGAGTGDAPVNIIEFGGSTVELGQGVKAASLPVTLASDQPDVGVNLDQVGGAAVTLGIKGQLHSIPVVPASDVSAPVTISGLPLETLQNTIVGLKAASIVNALAGSGTATIIAAVAGKTVTVYGFSWGLAGTNTGIVAASLRDTAGNNTFDNVETNIATLVGAVASPAHCLWIPGGFALPSGVGVQAANLTATAVNAVGSVYYTQL